MFLLFTEMVLHCQIYWHISTLLQESMHTLYHIFVPRNCKFLVFNNFYIRSRYRKIVGHNFPLFSSDLKILNLIYSLILVLLVMVNFTINRKSSFQHKKQIAYHKNIFIQYTNGEKPFLEDNIFIIISPWLPPAQSCGKKFALHGNKCILVSDPTHTLSHIFNFGQFNFDFQFFSNFYIQSGY